MNDTLTKHPVLVAFQTECKGDFTEGVEFAAPSNWKDPEKIQREISRKCDKFAEEAKDCMLTGRLKRIIAVSPFTEAFCDSDSRPEGQTPAMEFVHWLTEQVDSGEQPVLVGFGAKTAGRLALFESLREIAYPASWWEDKSVLGIDAIDPFEILVETAELRKQFGHTKLLQQLGIECPPDYKPHVDLSTDLQLAATIAVDLGILGDGQILELVAPPKEEQAAEPEAPVEKNEEAAAAV